MRTIASTLDTRQQAELASAKLKALGIGPEHIIVREIEDGDGAAGRIFISAKVAPDQVDAARRILNGASGEIQADARAPEAPGAPQSSAAGASPLQSRAPETPAPELGGEGFWVEEPAGAGQTGAAAAAARAAPAREEPGRARSSEAPAIPTRRGPGPEGGSGREAGLARVRRETGGFSRLFVIAVLLAAAGVAIGAMIGTLA
jgi:hypothetical protein